MAKDKSQRKPPANGGASAAEPVGEQAAATQADATQGTGSADASDAAATTPADAAAEAKKTAQREAKRATTEAQRQVARLAKKLADVVAKSYKNGPYLSDGEGIAISEGEILDNLISPLDLALEAGFKNLDKPAVTRARGKTASELKADYAAAADKFKAGEITNDEFLVLSARIQGQIRAREREDKKAATDAGSADVGDGVQQAADSQAA